MTVSHYTWSVISHWSAVPGLVLFKQPLYTRKYQYIGGWVMEVETMYNRVTFELVRTSRFNHMQNVINDISLILNIKKVNTLSINTRDVWGQLYITK